nr:acyl-homoserine-lactone synthase [Bradyrhizobium sp. WSM2793]
MHRLRYRVFKRHLGWDIQVSGDMEEADELTSFDRCICCIARRMEGSRAACTASALDRSDYA